MVEPDAVERRLNRLEHRDHVRSWVVVGLVIVCAVAGIWGAHVISGLTDTLDTRNSIISYLSEASERQDCQDDKENEYEIAQAQVLIEAIGSGPITDGAKQHLVETKRDLENVDEVCPPRPAAPEPS